MSMVTRSTKRNRVYARKFDHDLARMLYEQDVPVSHIAEEAGVSDAAVWRVLDPELRERMDGATKRFLATTCEDCGGVCTKSQYSKHRRHDRNLCPACGGRRDKAEMLKEREDERGFILCVRCADHRPRDEYLWLTTGFPASYSCRSCRTAQQQATRLKRLTGKERTRAIVRLRASGMTLSEIGQTFGLTAERVRQIEAKAA